MIVYFSYYILPSRVYSTVYYQLQYDTCTGVFFRMKISQKSGSVRHRAPLMCRAMNNPLIIRLKPSPIGRTAPSQ